MKPKKLLIKSICNDEQFNEIELGLSQVFLDNLQTFVIDCGLVSKKDMYLDNDDKNYDTTTFYTLFYEDHKKDFELRENKIKDFGCGYTIRYHKKGLEMLIIFFKNRIKLMFYCNKKRRKLVIDSLLKFSKFARVS